jgi:hypothetical protein
MQIEALLQKVQFSEILKKTSTVTEQFLSVLISYVVLCYPVG